MLESAVYLFRAWLAAQSLMFGICFVCHNPHVLHISPGSAHVLGRPFAPSVQIGHLKCVRIYCLLKCCRVLPRIAKTVFVHDFPMLRKDVSERREPFQQDIAGVRVHAFQRFGVIVHHNPLHLRPPPSDFKHVQVIVLPIEDCLDKIV